MDDLNTTNGGDQQPVEGTEEEETTAPEGEGVSEPGLGADQPAE
ncbi:MAG: hypothetical protein ACOCU8_00145 [Patescibacteria group bacterium]